MKAKLLWIEGKRADSPSFIPGLRKKGYTIEPVSTGKAALACMAEVDPDVVVVNAASMRTSGKRICQSLRNEADNLPVLLIASPDYPVEVDEVVADIVLELPFTLRKLVNRIVPMLPGDEANMLHAGPIHLDVERNWVRCEDRESKLTPRLALLLKALMKRPGDVLEREALFRDVWNTEYTGDTRTLDVHISWLRGAIEEDPRNPQYLMTIRGVGYCLDV